MSDNIADPFYLASLVAAASRGAPPRTDFANGESFYLDWQSNGTSFSVYAGQGKILDCTTPGCTINGLTRNTTLVVMASLAGGPDSGTPNPNFETIYLYGSITITVSNPDETPSTVAVGTVSVAQTSTVGGLSSLADVTADSLLVMGHTSLNGGVSTAQLSSALADLGATTIGDATITGTLQVVGESTLGRASIGTVSVSDSVTMFTAVPVTAETSYAGATDGILLGSIWNTDDPYYGQAVTRICGVVDGVGEAWATGGSFVTSYVNTFAGNSVNANSFTLPVPRNTTFTTHVYNDAHAVPPTSFVWVGFGRNATVTPVANDDTAASGMRHRDPSQP